MEYKSIIQWTWIFSLLVNITRSEELLNNKDTEATNLTDADDTNWDIFHKHELFSTCTAFTLDSDEFVMFSNGTAYVEAYNKTYNSSFYHLENNRLKVCAPAPTENAETTDTPVRYHKFFYYVTRTCLIISIVCLLLHLTAFCLVPDLRNLPGFCLVSLCVSLLLFYILFLMSDAMLITTSSTSCIVIASFSYFLILSAFMWMAVMGFDIFRSLLKATGRLRLATRRFVFRRFFVYCVFSWGMSLAFVVTALFMDNTEKIPKEFRPGIGDGVCWFTGRKALLILFAGPVFVIISANILFFFASAYIIYTNRLQTVETSNRTVLRKNFTLHYRLATIMGLTWIVGFANTTQNFTLLSVYIFMSSLQGFFILLACSCTSKVRNNIKERFRGRNRKISVISTTATFQSYWNEEFCMEPEIYTITEKGNNGVKKSSSDNV